MTDILRIVIADDIVPFRVGLREMLEELSCVRIVGEARDAAEAIRLACALKPDIILIDVCWRGVGESALSAQSHHDAGLNAIRQIRRQAPTVAILAMTAYTELVEPARRNGADVAAPKELLNDFDSLEKLLRQTIEQARSAHRRQVEYPPLTDRERQVLSLIAQGLTDQEITERIPWGIGVVKRDIQSIFQKLDAKNRAQAVARAYDIGWLSRNSSFPSDSQQE